ncbi:MAG: GNAT family N-acetyltransferase [Gammaproteobacteria bacterium]|nr:GNAT family N-acetyltransferase [Gammaproteobacteria bacterium]MDH4254567.1 GNAT family N-acetyltransferase [Gammaproteobacteria bacterium]MDH5310899.1 GNAT family N-acetyltransferase [Gammaproteobacteria bacterium]
MPPPDGNVRDADALSVGIAAGIARLDRDQWNGLAGTDYPFLRHEFLSAAEETGCVSEATGWTPRHLTITDADGRLLAAMPLYEKAHSWGEFVFDWSWAHAYEQAGISYYPKLVSATPFTPATGPRLLLAPDAPAGLDRRLVEAALALARDGNYSSLHVQFPPQAELELYRECGLKLRKDCQFHWHNDSYQSFDEFLGRLSSAKRKKLRRERRRVAEQGIGFRHLAGDEIDAALWQRIYQLISVTFLRRGSMPYFSLDFFRLLSQRLPRQVLVILAERGPDAVGVAICYRGANRLYGRYWGSDGYYDALHFETCYLQGIEYCIAHGIEVFEPGTQGEHKIARGFVPVDTWSAHWLARPEFHAAIGRYLDAERRHVDRYIDAIEDHTPYRRDAGDSE